MFPMDTKPVTRGNDVVLTSKPCHQTSPVPYSNENRSKIPYFSLDCRCRRKDNERTMIEDSVIIHFI